MAPFEKTFAGTVYARLKGVSLTVNNNSSISGDNSGDQTDATLPFTDITTNNASLLKHGFLKKLSGTAGQYMDSSGNWTVPAGTSTGTVTSVGISGSDFVIGSSPITTSGTITLAITNAAVIGKVLTGYVSGAGVLLATDTILQAFQKLNGNLAGWNLEQVLLAGNNANSNYMSNVTYIEYAQSTINIQTSELKYGAGGATLDWHNRILKTGQWDYAADYSASYTSRSLVDKAYVTSAIAALVTGVSSVNSLTGAVALTGTANKITISAANVFNIGSDVVTLTGAQALSNKTGLISQWTNDTGYLTSTAITAGQIGFGSAGNVLTSDPTFLWDNTNKNFTITGTIGQILSNTANVWYVAQGNVGYWYTGAASTGLSNHQGFGIDFKVNNKYTMGDVGITNNTHIEVNDTAQTVKVSNLAGVGTRMVVADATGFITTQAITTGTVTSVSGTVNRITSTGGATPVIDISASYVGQSSITTLGTISSGTWNGGVISPVYGGTGVANNVASTLTISGAFASTLTVTGVTGVTLPTSGTLYGTLAGSITSAQLASSLTDETGTLLSVFSDSPTFTTQIIAPLIYGSTAANGDITIEGTSSATKTTSYVNVQTTGGSFGIGTTSPIKQFDMSKINTYAEFSINTWASGIDESSVLYLNKSKSNATGSYTIVANGDSLGYLVWQGSTGTAFRQGAAIKTSVIGTPSLTVMPSDMIFFTSGQITQNQEVIRLTNTFRLGVGTGATVSAKIHSLSTTEQLRLGYDASNYYSTTVGSTGAVTFDAVGAGAKFTFSDTIVFPTPFTLGATSVTTTGTQLNYLNAATGTTGTASTNLVFSASPTFTGVPIAPTAAAGTNTTQLATTAFVTTAITGVANVYEATVDLTSAEILNIYTTPKQIVAAPGAGKYIEFISGSVTLTYVSAAYATNLYLILTNNSTNPNTDVAYSYVLGSTATQTLSFNDDNFVPNLATGNTLTNTPLYVGTLTGNPITGTGTARVRIMYRIVTI